MKVTGIIAEYNPFHNGHLYQLQKAREETGADYMVVVMGGNFMQRGTPALLDKYARTRMALYGGADLVLELPALWATASAEYFASAGVALLDKLGVTDVISFGAENANTDLLLQLAGVLAEEPAPYKVCLSEELKQGNPFPAARKAALLGSGVLPDTTDFAVIGAILDTPNNILAIEYLKALKQRGSSIHPMPVLRQGSGYHEQTLRPLASASAIRSGIHQSGGLEGLSHTMPDTSFSLLRAYEEEFPFLDENHFSSILKYKLLLGAADGFAAYADCNEDLSNRIVNRLKDYVSYSGFCDLLKSREVTHTRISRVLLHILLEIRQEDYQTGRSCDYIPYIRALGFRKDAAPLLSAIKKNASVPFLTKVADARQILSLAASDPNPALQIFAKDIFAADLYSSVLTDLTARTLPNEYTQGLVIV